MKIPAKYATWRNPLEFDELSFGISGIRLFSMAEMDDAQVGYSRTEDGRSLCDGSKGCWKPEWIVIGHETGLGDPIILDASSLKFPVMTAMHGEGEWSPQMIAESLEAFGASLQAVKEISAGREDPAALEQNPLSDNDRERVLERIKSANRSEMDLDFWAAILEE